MKKSAKLVLITVQLFLCLTAALANPTGSWETFSPSQRHNVILDWIEKSGDRIRWSHDARKEFALSAYTHSLKIEDPGLKMKAMYNLAELYLNEARFELALTYFDSLQVYANETSNPELSIKTDNQIATIYRYRGNTIEALNLSYDSYLLAKEIKSKGLIALSANQLGFIYRNLGEFKSALDFYTEALEAATNAGDTNQIIMSYMGFGNYFWYEKEINKAYDYYKLAMDLARKIIDLQHIASLNNNIGNIYREKGEFNLALQYYNNASILLEEVKVTGLKAIIIRNKGIVYQRQGNTIEALNHILQSTDIFKEIEINSFIRENYLTLSQIYHSTGNINEAYNYLKLYNELNTEINEGQLLNRVSYFNDKLIDAQRSEELYRYRYRTNLFIFIIVLLVLLLLGLYTFLTYRRSMERKKEFFRLKNTLQDKIIIEKALRKSEENFQTLIKTLNEGLIVLDQNNKIEFLNQKAIKILGSHENQDLTGFSFEDFLLASDDIKLFHEKMELQKMGISDQYEVKMRNKAGDVLWAHLSSAPILDENQNPQGNVTLISDVTEKKKSEQTYGELTTNLNQKIKQLNCLYDITDISGVPGITFEEIMAKSLEIIPVGLRYSHDIGVQIAFDNKVYSSENFADSPWSYSVPIKVQKKKLGYVKVAYIEEKPNINKDPFHFSEKILLKNISEKFGKIIESKNLESTLRENQEKLQEVQRIAKIGNWEKDLTSDHCYFSESFFDIVHISPEKRRFFDYSKFLEIIHPDDKENFSEFEKRVTENKKQTDITAGYRVITNEGEIIFLFSSGKIIRNDINGSSVCLFTIQDVTEQKYAQELKHHAELALKTSETKQQIVANISYEMRTPITGILGMIDFLIDSKLNTRQMELANTIKDSGNLLLNSINNILDLQRIEAGKFRLNNISFSLEQLLEKIHSLFTALTRSKEINLRLEIHPEIPGNIISDPERLYQVITNLISIITGSASGKGTMSISMRPQSILGDKMMILTEITDNFSNFSIDEAKAALSRGQEDVLMQKKDNSIVGLAISRKLVDMLDGSIGVERTGKNETTFYFTFFASIAAESGKPELKNARIDSDMSSLKGVKILCAEDQRINQKVISLMLSHAQCDVTMVNNGQEALEMLNKSTFDVILLDMVMPVLNGIETLKVLNEKSVPHPPVIALSANVMDEDRERYYFAGVCDFISKPINAEELYAKIKKWHNSTQKPELNKQNN
jgi:PAS domain S-box-containing protein